MAILTFTNLLGDGDMSNPENYREKRLPVEGEIVAYGNCGMDIHINNGVPIIPEHLHYRVYTCKDNWIKCSERLPDSPDDVLVVFESGAIGMASFGPVWYPPSNSERSAKISATITHWQPLPERPRE